MIFDIKLSMTFNIKFSAAFNIQADMFCENNKRTWKKIIITKKIIIHIIIKKTTWLTAIKIMINHMI